MPKSSSNVERKWRRTLRELLARSASTNEHHWLNRFIAERVCSDHTLPSTISEMERTKGLHFERKEIEVSGYAGETARVMAYRLAERSIERARELLGLGNGASHGHAS